MRELEFRTRQTDKTKEELIDEMWEIYKENQQLKKRKKLYDKCVKEMKWLIEIYWSYPHLSKVVTTIKNGLDFWFTRILHPRIEPTNNGAEQPLREMKVIQKIIGTLRNEDGARIMETIMTLLATWKLQEKNSFTELRSIL